MSDKFKGYAAEQKGRKLLPIEFDPGSLREQEVEIKVSHCGVCHSDLSMLDNEWGQTTYPFVPGHEIVGVVSSVGDHVENVKPGDLVGVGWMSGSCMACAQCLSGNQNLCERGEQTIVGRPGGFADRVRCHWQWAFPLPKNVNASTAGPLFCGGITVFTPLMEFGVRPVDRVGVVGIGGLGHMALKFLNKWGCEVWALTSSNSKREEAMAMGAHHVVNSRDPEALKGLAGTLDFLLVTVNVPMDWAGLIGSLAPNGRMHFVGAVLQDVPLPVFSLISAQRSISGSPVGNPTNLKLMLDFCARHNIAPQVETFAMSEVNKALEHLKAGKARYRIVLNSDF